MSKLRSIVDHTYEAFNARDFDAYRELLDENVELVMSGVHLRGIAAVTDFVTATARARPGLRIEPRRVFAETSDTVVTEVRMIDLAPPGSSGEAGTVETSACGLYRVVGGRIVEWCVYLDSAGQDLASVALTAVAAEQSALRRVAELIARQTSPEQMFVFVAEDLGHFLAADMTRTVRFEPDGSVTVLAGLGRLAERLSPGTNVPLSKGGVLDQVFRSGRPARVEDYSQVGGPIGAVLREEGVRCSVAAPIVIEAQLWGAMVAASRTAETLPPGSEERVARFAELMSTALSNIHSRAQVDRLAAEQSALRRVAEAVARRTPSEQVFALVCEEVSRLLDVDQVRVARFEPDGTVTIMASRGAVEDRLAPGTNVPRARGTVVDLVFRTGAPSRVEDYAQVPDPVGTILREQGVHQGAGGPIVVDGHLWGAMVVGHSKNPVLPPATEERVAQFAELVSTAISNIESQAEVTRLAAEQSALRRVATLVAREYSPDALFAALAEELGVLLEVDATAILRYEVDASTTVVAGWSSGAITLPLGARLRLAGENLAGEVHRTGAPQRKEDYTDAPGEIAATVRELGIRSAVASPIVVEGQAWGVIAVLSLKPDSLPTNTEARIAEFGSHAAVAVANAKSRSDLAQSRARIVQAGDEARRRFERDLHDGAQQRLVSLELELREAEVTMPPELVELRRALSGVATELHAVVDDLRELSRGLHPAVLAEGGLAAALRALVRRSAVPVELRLDLGEQRLEERVEVAAYYVASEALTNTAKHANASRAEVLVAQHAGWLELIVRDNGKGGADASSGTGLTGLFDRVEAIGGTIQIESTPQAGTALRVRLPTASKR